MLVVLQQLLLHMYIYTAIILCVYVSNDVVAYKELHTFTDM